MRPSKSGVESSYSDSFHSNSGHLLLSRLLFTHLESAQLPPFSRLFIHLLVIKSLFSDLVSAKMKYLRFLLLSVLTIFINLSVEAKPSCKAEIRTRREVPKDLLTKYNLQESILKEP
jgi:hypothetical protein